METISNSYQCDVLQSQHAEEVIKLITESFCHFEPMTRHLKINIPEFTPLAMMIAEKAVLDKSSIVALQNNEVVACSIVEDITDPLNITMHLDSRFKYIFSLMDQLGNTFFEDRDFAANQIAHLFVTAVNKNHMGKHLSTLVNAESMRLALKNNFSFMYSEFSNLHKEQGTLNHLENASLLVSECSYPDFVFNNEKPFAELKGSACAYIWELKKGAKLYYRQSGKSYLRTLEELNRPVAEMA